MSKNYSSFERELEESGKLIYTNVGVLTSLVRDGKEFNFDGLLYRLYVRVWCAPYRLRFFLLRVTRGARAFFSAVRHKLFQK